MYDDSKQSVSGVCCRKRTKVSHTRLILGVNSWRLVWLLTPVCLSGERHLANKCRQGVHGRKKTQKTWSEQRYVMVTLEEFFTDFHKLCLWKTPQLTNGETVKTYCIQSICWILWEKNQLKWKSLFKLATYHRTKLRPRHL